MCVQLENLFKLIINNNWTCQTLPLNSKIGPICPRFLLRWSWRFDDLLFKKMEFKAYYHSICYIHSEDFDSDFELKAGSFQLYQEALSTDEHSFFWERMEDLIVQPRTACPSASITTGQCVFNVLFC